MWSNTCDSIWQGREIDTDRYVWDQMPFSNDQYIAFFCFFLFFVLLFFFFILYSKHYTTHNEGNRETSIGHNSNTTTQLKYLWEKYFEVPGERGEDGTYSYDRISGCFQKLKWSVPPNFTNPGNVTILGSLPSRTRNVDVSLLHLNQPLIIYSVYSEVTGCTPAASVCR